MTTVSLGEWARRTTTKHRAILPRRLTRKTTDAVRKPISKRKSRIILRRRNGRKRRCWSWWSDQALVRPHTHTHTHTHMDCTVQYDGLLHRWVRRWAKSPILDEQILLQRSHAMPCWCCWRPGACGLPVSTHTHTHAQTQPQTPFQQLLFRWSLSLACWSFHLERTSLQHLCQDSFCQVPKAV